MKLLKSAFQQHGILLEDGAKPMRESQRRLNPLILDVVKKEVTVLIQVGIIYPIFDSKRVKGAHRLQEIETRPLEKYHYHLLFIDQTLELLAIKSDYCFYDGYTGYFQIHIAPKDQEKNSFICPFATYAYSKMPCEKLLCDASNYVLLVDLAQRNRKFPHVIFYASQTLDAAQANHTTTEKKLLATMFASNKFRSS
ncbi:hypothetical protein L6164_028401 [Bauhinia variegata]|uniref:Uncharacterized protein n=1 Tax=Bauhinia variegata TaxID=167791 RepID=A0ACB9L616_BAUVA|nr:hypothetical protein L6164_028401 [Bauhinia variegata]